MGVASDDDMSRRGLADVVGRALVRGALHNQGHRIGVAKQFTTVPGSSTLFVDSPLA